MKADSAALRCDGCGQAASAEHTARRLQRLEWTTRYRPVHIQTLLLGAWSPLDERDFLYSPQAEFLGEGALLLKALSISTEEKTAETVRAEFQRAGFFLTYVLECPIEPEYSDTSKASSLLADHLPGAAARIRRSLKPKRALLFNRRLDPIVEQMLRSDFGCPIVMDEGKPFELDSGAATGGLERLRAALGLGSHAAD